MKQCVCVYIYIYIMCIHAYVYVHVCVCQTESTMHEPTAEVSFSKANTQAKDVDDRSES